MASIYFNESTNKYILNTSIPGSESVSVDITKAKAQHRDPVTGKTLLEAIKSQVSSAEEAAKTQTISPLDLSNIIGRIISRAVPESLYLEANSDDNNSTDSYDPNIAKNVTTATPNNTSASAQSISATSTASTKTNLDASEDKDAFENLKEAQKKNKNAFTNYQEIIGGQDMSVFFMSEVPVLSDVLDGFDIEDCRKELLVFEMDNVLSLQYSIIREVFPVRQLGKPNPVSFTRGPRTIAGHIAFSIFSEDILTRLRSRVLESFGKLLDSARKESASDSSSLKLYRYYDAALQFDNVQLLDSLPPFHLLAMGVNENGILSKFIIKNVSFVDENQTQGVRFPNTMNKATFVAADIVPMYMGDMDTIASQSIGSSGEGNVVSSMKNMSASEILKKEIESDF